MSHVWTATHKKVDRITRLLDINPYSKRLYKLRWFRLDRLDDEDVYEFFCECLMVYRNAHVKNSDRFVEHIARIENSKYRTIAIMLSVYARWCLEHEYSHVGFMLFPYSAEFCVACCIEDVDGFSWYDCDACRLYQYCSHIVGGEYSEADVYIKTHMLEWFRDGLLKELSSRGVDYAWEWLPYFEDSTLDLEV
jgi:hypothetical protein